MSFASTDYGARSPSLSVTAIYQQPSDLADKTDVRKSLLQRPRHG
jgi:hypothetical protein